MIGQPKPFASLSSTLLARKGTARPAMRPQGFGGFGSLQSQDDLGWNDMGDPHDAHAHHDAHAFHDAHALHDTQPVVPPVLMQREVLQREMLGDEFDASPIPAHAPDALEELEEEFEEEAEPVFESVLAVKPIRALDPSIAQPVVAPPVVAPPAVVLPAVAPVAVDAVPLPATLPLAHAARIARETSAKRGKAAFTLRLDHERHLHLRLASALKNRSAQQLVTEALDAFLDTLPEVAELADQLSPQAAR